MCTEEERALVLAAQSLVLKQPQYNSKKRVFIASSVIQILGFSISSVLVQYKGNFDKRGEEKGEPVPLLVVISSIRGEEVIVAFF